MGKPIKIMDLASNMIKLAGLTKEKDISIVITGLRPGEKLYEELLNEKEKTIPTHHEKIKIAKIISCSYHKVMHDIEELIHLCDQEDNNVLVRKMKDMVPEFISKNSRYEELDVYTSADKEVVA
jgi:FlaA1/EpsC-like NDP-sugar epimerase